MNHASQNRQAPSEPNAVVVDAAAHLARRQLRDMPCPTELRVPDAQFPNKVPAGRRRSGDVIVAATDGHAEALCGRQLPAESLTLINGSAGALCMACVADIAPKSNDPGPRDIP